MRREQKAILRRAVEGHLRTQILQAEKIVRQEISNRRHPAWSREENQEFIRKAILVLRMARYTYEAASPNSRDK